MGFAPGQQARPEIVARRLATEPVGQRRQLGEGAQVLLVLAHIFGLGLAQVQVGAAEQPLKAGQMRRFGRSCQYLRQGGFPRADPALHELRVIDQKGAMPRPVALPTPR